MSLLTGAIFSKTLMMDTTVSVILPHDSRWHRGFSQVADGVKLCEKPRTLILLHGLSDNWIAWPYRSRILSHAELYDVAVLMPEVQRSFYQDMTYGEAYFTYITEELPTLASRMFHLSTEPEDLMICGLSMGGYGALKCGLTNPERYRAIGAFSSLIDFEAFVADPFVRRTTEGMDRVLKSVLGENLEVPDSAKLRVLCDREAGSSLPFLMTCGTEDDFYLQNEAFYSYMKKNDMNVSFEKWPGKHEWNVWDESVQRFLERFAKDK